jgi:hypothetical protein
MHETIITGTVIALCIAAPCCIPFVVVTAALAVAFARVLL